MDLETGNWLALGRIWRCIWLWHQDQSKKRWHSWHHYSWCWLWVGWNSSCWFGVPRVPKTMVNAGEIWRSSFGSTQGSIYICSARRSQWDSINCTLNHCLFCLMFMDHEFKKLEQNKIHGACLYLFSLDLLKLFQRWSPYVVLNSFSQMGALLVWHWNLNLHIIKTCSVSN